MAGSWLLVGDLWRGCRPGVLQLIDSLNAVGPLVYQNSRRTEINRLSGSETSKSDQEASAGSLPVGQPQPFFRGRAEGGVLASWRRIAILSCPRLAEIGLSSAFGLPLKNACDIFLSIGKKISEGNKVSSYEAAADVLAKLYGEEFGGKSSGRYRIPQKLLREMLGRRRLYEGDITALTRALLEKGYVLIDMDSFFVVMSVNAFVNYRRAGKETLPAVAAA